MEYLIEFYPDNKKIRIDDSHSILDALTELGIHITSLCNGQSTCGKCRVIVGEGKVKTGDTKLLTKKEREDNYYLACKTYPCSDLKVIIPDESTIGEHKILEHAQGIKKEALGSKSAGIAVDIGTTTVVAYLVDLENNKIVDSVSGYNKQMIHGGDVLTRINYAGEYGVEKLSRLIVETINGLIETLMKERSGAIIEKMALAGNTAMTYMLLNKDPTILKKDQDLDEFKDPHRTGADQLGIKSAGGLGDIYTLPGIGSYVGGDIVGDIIASGMHNSEKVSMLIDVGTNGEIVIGNKDWLVTCSTSAGPAFEGGETGCGMRATTGAIEKIKIKKPDGTGDEHGAKEGQGTNKDHGTSNGHSVEYATVHSDKPRGICGSGFIDLLAELFLNDILDHNGKFHSTGTGIETGRVRDGEFGREFLVVSGDETATGKDIVLTEKDIEGIMFSKAAIYAGASTLTTLGVSFGELDRIYVAGGFGYHLDVEKAIVLGLLPDLPKEKFEFIGNGSASGAYLVLTDDEKRKEAEDVARKTTYFDLSGDKTFNEEYMAALAIPHRDITLFPSVDELME